MKLLVTGGAGFIGSNLIRFWLKKHPTDKIINLDKLTYAGHIESTRDFSKNKNYRFVKGDICNRGVVEKVMKGVDTVIHLAAESHVDRSIAKPQVFLTTNVLGTQVLLEFALKNKIKRFHYVSTDEVFGALPLSGGKFNESTPYDPRSPYSASKAASDHLVRAYYHTFGLPVTVTNCSNNFGPYMDPEKLLARFITNLMDDKHLPIYGDGKYVRDWLYVEDHARAIDLVIHKGKPGETYLVGGQTKNMNNLEIAKKLIMMFGKDDSYIDFVQDRPGHDRRYAVNWGKIKKELGWTPMYKFDKALERTVAWYKGNEWWWKPLKQKTERRYKTYTKPQYLGKVREVL